MISKNNYLLLAALAIATFLPANANDGSALSTAATSTEMTTGASMATPADTTIEKAVQILKEMNSGSPSQSSASEARKQFKTNRILILGGSAAFPM
jgi:hypothetical protein